jgi:hypothetical protein
VVKATTRAGFIKNEAMRKLKSASGVVVYWVGYRQLKTLA